MIDGSADLGTREFAGQKFGYHVTFRVTFAEDDDKKDLEPSTDSLTPVEKPSASTKEIEFSEDVVDRFFLSIMGGDMVAVTGFLEAGMSTNVKRPRLGHSPLFAAVMAKHDDIALMLIQKGADVNFKDNNHSTALMWAAQNCGSISLVKALLNAGADVNAKAKGGNTPLQSAKIFQCEDIMQLLKKAGAK